MNRTEHLKFIGEIFISLLALFLTANICQCQISAYDGFESNKLSKIWSTERMDTKSLEIQSKIVKHGNRAVKITLKTNDTFEAGNAKSAPTERDELLQTSYYAPYEGLKYEYEFSMFLPEDFPVVNRRLVIAQWKQYCQGGDTALCSDDSPVLAIRYVAGGLYITLQTDSGVNKLYKLNDEIRNRWLDFKFQIRFSIQNDGEVRTFLNDKEIINYKGVTSYSEKHGYPAKSRYYFKMGLYRDIMAEPMTIYIDEFRMREIIE
jgi:hypothetical protein